MCYKYQNYPTPYLLCMELPSEPDDLQVEECEARTEGATDAPENSAGKDGLSRRFDIILATSLSFMVGYDN